MLINTYISIFLWVKTIQIAIQAMNFSSTQSNDNSRLKELFTRSKHDLSQL